MPITFIPYAGGDFRWPAAAASEAWLRDHPGVDPADAGVSLCVRAADDADIEATHRRLYQIALIGCSIALLLIIGGVMLMAAGVFMFSPSVFLLGPAATFTGSIVASATSALSFVIVRRVLRRRGVLPDRAHELIWANVEDAATFVKQKLVPEDLAAVVIHEPQRAIRIEGVRFRYFIHARDVRHIELRKQSNTMPTEIRCNVQGADLVLVLSGVQAAFLASVWQIFRRSPIHTRILATLAPPQLPQPMPPPPLPVTPSP